VTDVVVLVDAFVDEIRLDPANLPCSFAFHEMSMVVPEAGPFPSSVTPLASAVGCRALPETSRLTAKGNGPEGLYYCWRGKESARTVFEIAVADGPLNQEEKPDARPYWTKVQ
jgi:hypothetical protein